MNSDNYIDSLHLLLYEYVLYAATGCSVTAVATVWQYYGDLVLQKVNVSVIMSFRKTDYVGLYTCQRVCTLGQLIQCIF
jgi:hypothetical protein